MSSRKTLDYDCKTRFTETEYAAMLDAAWLAYEAGKKRLNELELSPAEYELAIKSLAETLGI
jgi:hypothetical protein